MVFRAGVGIFSSFFVSCSESYQLTRGDTSQRELCWQWGFHPYIWEINLAILNRWN